jgi:hypothetical protein
MRPSRERAWIRTVCLLLGLFPVSMAFHATPGTALAADSDRALVLYEFDLQNGHYVVLNIFDTSGLENKITYLAGIKFILDKDGFPEISLFYSEYQKRFVSKIIGGDYNNIGKIARRSKPL